MRDFLRLSKILWMKHRVWIVLFFAFTLFLSFSGTVQDAKDIDFQIEQTLIDIEWLHEVKDKKFGSADQFWDSEMKSHDAIAQRVNGFKVNGAFPKEVIDEAMKKYEELAAQIGYTAGDIEAYREIQYNPSDDYTAERLFKERVVFNDPMLNQSFPNGIVNTYSTGVLESILPMLFAVAFFAFLLTSAENFTAYREFTNTFPWSRQKNYWMKFIFGTILLTVLFALAMGGSYLLWRNNPYYAFTQQFQVFQPIAMAYVLMMILYVFAYGTGEIAGNFLGHIGMMIIALCGPKIIRFIVGGTLDTFGFHSVATAISDAIEVFRRNEIFDVIYYPISYLNTYKWPLIVLLFAIACIYLAIGAWTVSTQAQERTGYLVKSRGLSRVVQWIAVLTTTMILHSFMTLFIYDVGSVVSILFFALAFVMSFVFYKSMFKLKIGI